LHIAYDFFFVIGFWSGNPDRMILRQIAASR
jgi:hypothetical protein